MRSRGTTTQQDPPVPALVLVDRQRAAASTIATIVAGVVLVVGPVATAPGWGPLAGILLIPAWLVLVVRAARARTEVSTDGVRIRRVFSTRLVPAGDYDGVTWNLTLFPSGGASLAVKRKSGHPINAPSALSTWNKPLTPIDAEITDIGRLIEAALTGPPAAPHPYSRP